MDITDHAEDLVKEFAGAARREPATFDYDDEVLDNWVFFLLDNRDSDLLAQSNSDAIREDLSQWPDDVIFGTASHWGVGWVNFAFVRPYDEHGAFTAAMLSLTEIHCALSEYPVLDDGDYSRRQYEAQLESIDETFGRYCDSGLTPDDWTERVFTYLWHHADIRGDLFDEDNTLCAEAFETGIEALLMLCYIRCEECYRPATKQDLYGSDVFWCDIHEPAEDEE